MYLLFYSIAVVSSVLLLIVFNVGKIPVWKILLYGGFVYIVGLYGSRLLSLLETRSISSISLQEFLTNRSGLTFYGGYIPVFLVTLLFIRKISMSRKQFLRMCAIFLVVFHFGYAIGRLGCHYSADGCYGNITFSKLGMRYTWGLKPTLFPVHPTPLYEAVLNTDMALLFLLLFVVKKYRFIIYSSLLVFPLSRFFIEFIRNNAIIHWGLTLNQFISLGLLIIQTILFFTIEKRIDHENRKNILRGSAMPV